MEFLSMGAIRRGEGYASYSLRDDEKIVKLLDASLVLNCAYTDYGGTFMEKAFIQYFKEKFPDNIVTENTVYYGQNAIIFGSIMPELSKAMDEYLLGFRDIEEFYFEKEFEQTQTDFELFIKDVFPDIAQTKREEIFTWLMDYKSGYYNISPQGLDFSYEELEREVRNKVL